MSNQPSGGFGVGCSAWLGRLADGQVEFLCFMDKVTGLLQPLLDVCNRKVFGEGGIGQRRHVDYGQIERRDMTLMLRCDLCHFFPVLKRRVEHQFSFVFQKINFLLPSLADESQPGRDERNEKAN